MNHHEIRGFSHPQKNKLPSLREPVQHPRGVGLLRRAVRRMIQTIQAHPQGIEVRKHLRQSRQGQNIHSISVCVLSKP